MAKKKKESKNDSPLQAYIDEKGMDETCKLLGVSEYTIELVLKGEGSKVMLDRIENRLK